MWYKKAQQQQENPLNGKTNSVARKYVNRLIYPYTKGMFSDEDWSNVNKIWNALDNHGIDYALVSTQYNKNEEGIPMNKEWKFEIYFVNKNNKPTSPCEESAPEFIRGGESELFKLI